jgi:DNA polymerase III alpha subunit
MNDQLQTKDQYKRNIAFKLRIGDIQRGKPILEAERLRYLELNNKQIIRVNLIANIIDKYVQEGEKKFASLTLDDASGQIKIKTFGDDIEKFSPLNQGDTILVIGMLRYWNNEVYITPEIIKNKDPSFLLVRKLEVESEMPKNPPKETLIELKDKIIDMVKEAEKDGGLDIEKLILELKEHPDVINQEIKKLLEDGVVYEPRPGKLRWLG